MNKLASAALSTTGSAILLVVGTAIVVPSLLRGNYNYLRSIDGLSDFDPDDWARSVSEEIRHTHGIGRVNF